MDWKTTEAQQQFKRHELLGTGAHGGGSEARAYAAIRSATTEHGALSAHVRRFERPQHPEAEISKRSAYLRGMEGTDAARGPQTGEDAATQAGRSAAQAAAQEARAGGDHVTSTYRSPSHVLSRRFPRSAHTQNRAFDLRARTPEQADAAMERQRQRFAARGLVEGRDYRLRDEVRRPSGHATGPHVHVEFTPEGAQRYAAANRARRDDEPRKLATPEGSGRMPERSTPMAERATPQADTDAADKLRELREEARRPIPIRFEGNLPTLRERGARQASRELSAEFRDTRYSSYSDVGVA
jgi:hypothetical protein